MPPLDGSDVTPTKPDTVLMVQRIMSVVALLQSRPERDGHAIVSFNPGAAAATWVGVWPGRGEALDNAYRTLGIEAEFWVQDIAETLAWGPAAVAGEVEYQSWWLA